MLGEKQDAFLRVPPKFLNIKVGAVRSGKTTLDLITYPLRVRNAPKGGDLIITSRTQRTGYRNIVRPLQEMYGTRAVKFARGLGEGSFQGRTFYLLGGDNAQSAAKVMGITGSHWLSDETTLNPIEFIDACISRLSPEGSCADLSMNPYGPQHPFKLKFIDNLASTSRLIKFNLFDNAHNLGSRFIKSLLEMYPEGTVFHKRFVLGLWAMAEGLIYHNITEDKILVNKIPSTPPDHVDMCIDYGDDHPSSIGFYYSWDKPLDEAGFEGMQALHVFGLHLKGADNDIPIAQFVQNIFKAFPDDRLRHVYYDTASRTLRNQLRYYLKKNRHYFKQATVRGAKKDVLPGIRATNNVIELGRLKFLEGDAADDIVKQFQSYAWDQKANERGLSKPVKKDDDIMDQIRMYVYSKNRQWDVAA